MCYEKRHVGNDIEIVWGKDTYQFSIDQWEVACKLVSFIDINNPDNRLRLVRGLRDIFKTSTLNTSVLIFAANELY